MPLLIAMGATAGSAVADAGTQGYATDTEARGPAIPTTMFGITFQLVLLSGTGCPPEVGETPYGCVEYTADPPVVYMRDDLNRYTRRFVLRHEVGHIVCWRGLADTSEGCADRWAMAHMPKSKKRKRKRKPR